MKKNFIRFKAPAPELKSESRALRIVLLSTLFIGAVFSSSARASVPLRQRMSLNADWRFQKGDPPEAAGRFEYEKIKDLLALTGNELKKDAPAFAIPGDRSTLGSDIPCLRPGFDDSGWRRLDLPHDWGIEGPFAQEYPGETGKLAWWGAGWYRKHLNVPASDKGNRLFLDIDGAMAYSAVWLNGRFVGGWPYGYTSFRLDLTPYVRYGAENVIAIRVDNPPESSRWYPGSGIYRNVWLVKTGPIHFGHWGTFVSTPDVSEVRTAVEIEVTVENQSGAGADLTVETQVFSTDVEGNRLGEPVASSTPARLELPVGVSKTCTNKITVERPHLWSLEKRHLYSAVTTLKRNGRTVDSQETVFGIRTIKFDAARGLLLNGRRIPIQGVCNHHDLGALGTAINLRALQRQIELLQEIGVNAIRTSHNPPAPELLELCDRMGMVVMVEAFDCWKAGKKRNDYHRLFPDWHEKDLRAMVRRDRNHPSVVLWSIGNEVREQRDPEGQKIAAHLTQIVHEEDSTRPVSAGCDFIDSGHNGFQKTVDVFGYNYKPFEYKRFIESNPSIPLYSSESSSCISSRGEYFFPVSDDKAQGKERYQMSSYDLYAPRWATIPDVEFKGQDENPSVAGEFVWTGFDYLGEPTPYGDPKAPSRSSYFGILDLCGFKKDRAYSYQARWRPELPMAHIFPHWNWPERIGEITPVHVYTSGDEAELFLNGKSLGRKKKEPLQYRLRWDYVKYQPGELRVVAYKAGRNWAEDVVRTTGAAAKLLAKADRTNIHSNGSDLSFITVTIADKDGLMVPRSQNLVHFEIKGPAEIVAVDNGDATSHQSFKAEECKVYNGLCLVVIRSRSGQPGAIILRASSKGVAAVEVRLRSTPSRAAS